MCVPLICDALALAVLWFAWDIAKYTVIFCALFVVMLGSYLVASAISARVPPFLLGAIMLALVATIGRRLFARPAVHLKK